MALALVAAGLDDSSTATSSTPAAAAAPLDCGVGKKGSKEAARQLAAVNRSGDKQRIFNALATQGRFIWIIGLNRTGKPFLEEKNNRRKQRPPSPSTAGSRSASPGS